MKGNHLPIFALVIDYAMQLSMRRRVDLEGSRLASSVERETLPHCTCPHRPAPGYIHVSFVFP